MQNHGELPESMMKAMATTCPSCGTSFRVQQDQLTAAQGMVRCGSCLHIFQAKKDMPNTTSKPDIKLVEPEGTNQNKGSDDDLVFEDDPLVDWDDDEIYGDDFPEALKSTSNERPQTADDWASSSIDAAISSAHERLSSSNLSSSEYDEEIEDVDESWAHELLAELEAEDESGSKSASKNEPKIAPKKAQPQNKKAVAPKKRTSQSQSKTRANSATTHKKVASADVANRATKSSPTKSTSNTTAKNTTAPQQVVQKSQSVPVSHQSTKITETSNKQETPKAATSAAISRQKTSDNASSALKPKHLDNPIGHKKPRSEELPPLSDTVELTDTAESLLTNTQLSSELAEKTPAAQASFKTQRSSTWIWVFFNLLLVCGLAFQYVYFNFEELSKRARVRPLLIASCNILDCQLPSIQDVNLIHSGNLIVREHPQKDDALIIDVIISNQAIFDQPFPGIELAFSDYNDNAVANRIFTPSEYLGGDLTGASLMPPKTPVHLSIEVLDPGPQATNYELHFHGS